MRKIVIYNHSASSRFWLQLHRHSSAGAQHNAFKRMQSFADNPCDLCCNLFRWNFQGWTWVLDDESKYQYKFCPKCVRHVEESLDHALKNTDIENFQDTVGKALLYLKKTGKAGTASDAFTKRRKL